MNGISRKLSARPPFRIRRFFFALGQGLTANLQVPHGGEALPPGT
jgi:hypothetical protein